MPIAVGSKAPDFNLKSKNADGLVDVKLSANFGVKQTVLLFFPLAYTGVCTQEMCDQTSGLGEYEKLGAAVYGISVDSPFTLEAWAKTNKIGVTLLSDLNKETTHAYGVLFPFVRWQYYDGAMKFERNAPRNSVTETELGLEWQIRPEVELTTMYVMSDRTNVLVAPYDQVNGDVMRFQLQWNY